MTMTPEAKKALSATIRELRARLLDDLRDATESTYRLAARHTDAGLSAEASAKRRRLEAWIDEQARAQPAKNRRPADDFAREAEKQAAYTLLNRLIFIKLLEAPAPPGGPPIRPVPILKDGWESKGYKDFRALAPDICNDPHDPSAGFAFLLRLVFEDLSDDLPGLFGPAGIADLIPIPPATLRAVVTALNKPALQTCWTDDMTLGWVYQYWNDPEREALDAKINDGGKIEPHEIASKTQMFTERYMVDWLLQNTIGPLWLSLCRKHGWTPAVSAPAPNGAPSVLDRLAARRRDWRQQRDAGTVSLTDLMPLHDDAERRWAYYVPQPLSPDAALHAPNSIRDLKLLDPAVGSGHFLVCAFDLLFPLYQEEAHHRAEAHLPQWSDAAIANAILTHNLHGVDIDPRAVQIAAAALWLKARLRAPALSRPDRLNLVASSLRLAALPPSDPSLATFRQAIASDTGIPPALTDTLLRALRGADHLGSLLKIDAAVDAAIRQHEASSLARFAPVQPSLFGPPPPRQAALNFNPDDAKRSLLLNLEAFLSQHTSPDDLGLRLHGQQLSAGVRFVRLLKENQYDIVIGNPPYQGTSKMADAQYVAQHFPSAKADLYAAFLLRALDLCKPHGTSALLTMRNWMFIKQYSDLRETFFKNYDLRAIGDVSWGAFEEMRDNPVAMSIINKKNPSKEKSFALAPTDPQERIRTLEEVQKKASGLLCQVGRFDFNPHALKVVPEWPLVYWWDDKMLQAYQSAPLIGKVASVRLGVRTSDNNRYLRNPWEIQNSKPLSIFDKKLGNKLKWSPYIKGGEGRVWIEPLNCILLWEKYGLDIKVKLQMAYGMSTQSPEFYFRPGVAFSMIGSNFAARAHRYPSIFGNKGSSVFPQNIAQAVCAMNSTRARNILESLNPGIGFEVGDVNRLPLFPIAGAEEIFGQLEEVFGEHEGHREGSVEFRRPGPSRWRGAQAWAQGAVDRGEGEPLPPFEGVYDAEPATDHVSFGVGVALGRFGAGGEGILDPQDEGQLVGALPHGVLFLDGTLEGDDRRDSLGHPAAQALRDAWAAYGAQIEPKMGLRAWLATRFFGDVHRGMYENRPIHWPLSSASKTFVVWVTIHRLTAQTLRVVLADHLLPTLARLEGELKDLGESVGTASGDRKAARAVEKLRARRGQEVNELRAFIAAVEQCAYHGPPPPDPKCLARAQDAPYAPDLDDGVMINSAALWPLLEPQWKDPKKWWKELATASGKKDYDWSHLAMRYWPSRVDDKCKADPSLAVAHGCFWRYHPARAWAWELRLQDEIGPTFRITEAPYVPGGRDLSDPGDVGHRRRWLQDHPLEALEAVEREAARRMGRAKRRRLVSTVTLQEAGLWSREPKRLWDMEWRLSEKQGAELRILAPDEPEARAALLQQHPELAPSRAQLLAALTPAHDLFSDDPDPDTDDDTDPSPDADDE